MKKTKLSNGSEWKKAHHALGYLSRADKLPHRAEVESVLLEQIPTNVNRFLDLGTGDGRLLALLKKKHPDAEGVGLDFSEPMLELASKRFATDKSVTIIKHDLNFPLTISQLGCFDVVTSSLAIHHLTDERKKQIYQEIFSLLAPNGVFCNLEHVASSTKNLHKKFLQMISFTPETEDPSNKLLDVETQLRWLREIGFVDVDCYWKWFEVALLVGIKT
jgi:SAM-dependent methyltransferase